jgi:hypothetical protein
MSDTKHTNAITTTINGQEVLVWLVVDNDDIVLKVAAKSSFASTPDPDFNEDGCYILGVSRSSGVTILFGGIHGDLGLALNESNGDYFIAVRRDDGLPNLAETIEKHVKMLRGPINFIPSVKGQNSLTEYYSAVPAEVEPPISERWKTMNSLARTEWLSEQGLSDDTAYELGQRDWEKLPEEITEDQD